MMLDFEDNTILKENLGTLGGGEYNLYGKCMELRPESGI